jgi:Na+-transporting NADH:ubiquinone oxidoreductase subunit NqrB
MNAKAPVQPSRDAIYRLIQWVMLGDILIGVVFVGIGALVDEPAFMVVGAGLALIGFALFLFFRFLARRAAVDDLRRSRPHGLRR